MRRHAIAFVAQHVEHHIAREKHVSQLVNHLLLQWELSLLEDRLIEKGDALDGVGKLVLREFSFFASHLYRSDFRHQVPTLDFANSREKTCAVSRARLTERRSVHESFPLVYFVAARDSAVTDRSQKVKHSNDRRAWNETLQRRRDEGARQIPRQRFARGARPWYTR